ncbi:SCO6880 family protein [Sporichthya sp.]|uniref:SCO6880 family protein n=1 Tax=Sporichthya sp. TaxID=65475 RepID=UPI0025FA9AB3|nr:SCO6880 family protein [Sporichthya sp.]
MTVTEVRFGRLERRGLLLGLTGAQVGLVGVALVTVVAAGVAAGPAGILLGAPVWAAALAWALVPVGGRPLVEVLPTVAGWATRRLTRSHRDLAAPDAAAVPETLDLPGLPSRLHVTADDHGAAMLRCGRGPGAPVTLVAEVCGRGFLLESSAAQDRRVAAWGRLLGSLCQLPDVVGAQVLHRAIPAAGQEIRQWWSGQVSPQSPWAERIVADLVEDTRTDTRLQLLVAVAVRPRRADLIAARTALSESFDAAELDLVSWLTPGQIAALVRTAYDPASATRPLASSGAQIGRSRPMGVAEQWSHARSDSAFHATYWVSEWPRAATHASFLRPLLFGAGVQRTFTLLARPLPPGKSLREIRRARAEQVADASTRARVGRVEEEAHRAAAAELTRREEDLIAGHGDLRFTGLLAVSAPMLDELAEACASIETAAAQAGCELRRLVGQQVQAYAVASLPLGRGLW